MMFRLVTPPKLAGVRLTEAAVVVQRLYARTLCTVGGRDRSRTTRGIAGNGCSGSESDEYFRSLDRRIPKELFVVAGWPKIGR